MLQCSKPRMSLDSVKVRVRGMFQGEMPSMASQTHPVLLYDCETRLVSATYSKIANCKIANLQCGFVLTY